MSEEGLIDPLHAYQGDDRDLRDTIEQVLIREVIIAGKTGRPLSRTLWTANKIMALVEAARDKQP